MFVSLFLIAAVLVLHTSVLSRIHTFTVVFTPSELTSCLFIAEQHLLTKCMKLFKRLRDVWYHSFFSVYLNPFSAPLRLCDAWSSSSRSVLLLWKLNFSIKCLFPSVSILPCPCESRFNPPRDIYLCSAVGSILHTERTAAAWSSESESI